MWVDGANLTPDQIQDFLWNFIFGASGFALGMWVRAVWVEEERRVRRRLRRRRSEQARDVEVPLLHRGGSQRP